MREFAVTGGHLVVPGEEGRVRVVAGDLVIRDREIAAVLPAGEVPPGGPPEDVVDASGCAVLPGLVNAHCHAAMSLLRGYADDMPLMRWLEDRIWPAEAHLLPEDVYWGTALAALEMLRGGVTTFADMYFHTDQAARAVADAGMRGVLSLGLIG
ncbi:MAG: amidohydrolase family protein, partial [Bacillota bacterium]